MSPISAALADRLALAVTSRQAATTLELEAKRQLEAAAAADRAAAAARAELALARDEAQTLAELTAARLGDVRASLADATRASERAADEAAGGSLEVELGTTGERVAVLGRLAEAHQRRAAAAQDQVDQLEARLAAHDAGEAVRQAEQLEQLMMSQAEHVDVLLHQATDLAAVTFTAIDRRRATHPAEPWQHGLILPGGRFLALQAAFQLASWAANPARVSIGNCDAKGFGEAVATTISCWQQGREGRQLVSDQAA